MNYNTIRVTIVYKITYTMQHNTRDELQYNTCDYVYKITYTIQYNTCDNLQYKTCDDCIQSNIYTNH